MLTCLFCICEPGICQKTPTFFYCLATRVRHFSRWLGLVTEHEEVLQDFNSGYQRMGKYQSYQGSSMVSVIKTWLFCLMSQHLSLWGWQEDHRNRPPAQRSWQRVFYKSLAKQVIFYLHTKRELIYHFSRQYVPAESWHCQCGVILHLQLIQTAPLVNST